jgi:hypothetical protein
LSVPNKHAVLGCALLSLAVALHPTNVKSLIPSAAPSIPVATSDLTTAGDENRLTLVGRPWWTQGMDSWWDQTTGAWDDALAAADADGDAPSAEAAGAPAGDVPQAPAEAAPAPEQEAPADDDAAPPPPPHPESWLDANQLVVLYGSPLSSGLGVLGTFPPAEAAARTRQHADYYNHLNGDGRGAIGAMDLIYGIAQAEATGNGRYIRYMDDATVNEYIRLAEQNDVQLILDHQIGRGNIVEEVKKMERFLLNPRVHVAVDPEYAVGPNGVPIQTPGYISGHEINELQTYLAQLVEQHNLPPKILVIHQYIDTTVTDGEQVRLLPNVDLVLNMDAFGEDAAKQNKYRAYSGKPYAEHMGFNVFLRQDHKVLSEQEILALNPMPDVVFYQ